MAQAPHLLGFAASIMVAVGYLPQIAHLARERCARGVSNGAWRLWSLASLLVLLYALSVADWVISTFAAVQLTATIIIAALSTKLPTMLGRISTGSHEGGTKQ